ncbi:MAG: PilZ domain-containing protein, partial [Acidobacteriota bacterium]
MHPPDPSSFSAQRHATRAPVDLPVRLRADGEETLLEGRCNNVSIGGMFVETDAFCEAGQQMQFELQINEEQSIEGRAEVIWRQQGDLRRRPGVGFRFRYLEQRDRQAIFKLVSRHIKDRLAARQPRADDAVDPRAAGEPSPMLSAPEVVSLAAEDAAPPRSLGPDAATPEGPPTPPAFDVPPAAVPPVTVPLSPDELAAAFRPPAAASAEAAAPSGAESSPGFRVFDDPEPAAAVVPSRLEDFAPNVSEASGVDLMPLASAAQARSPAEPALAGEAPAVPNAGPTLLDEGEPERPFGAEEGPLDSVEGPPAVAREPQPAAPQPQARSGVLELPDDFELRGAGAPTFDPVHPAVPARTDDPLPGRGDPFSGGRPSPRRDWPLPVILGLVLLLVGALAYLFGGHLFDLESGAARI